MTYRKFKADYLFTGKELAPEGSVLITSDEGTVLSIQPATEVGDPVEYYPGWLSPGFINCHCHLELSHMKGSLPEGTGLVDFLLSVIRGRGPVAPPHTLHEQRIQDAIRRGEEEMLAGGIMGVGDICNTADTLARKREGHLRYHNFVETLGFTGQGAEGRFAQARSVFDSFASAGPLSSSIVPHAPYSVSPALFRLIAGFPGNRLLTIHNQESAAENEFLQSGSGDFLRLYATLGLDVSFFRGTGKRSLASYLPYFYDSQPGRTLLLVHNVVTSKEDLDFAMGAAPDSPANDVSAAGADPASAGFVGPDLFFCLCPNANRYIGRTLPDVDLLVRRGCAIVLGTDSLASNQGLSILEEMKTLQSAFPSLTTPDLLLWATSNGARALQMEQELGSFEPGRRPGLLLLDHMDNGKFSAASRVRRLL